MNGNPVIILGAGGHAKVIADILRITNRKILGFVTPDAKPQMEFFGSVILGDDSFIEKYSTDEINLVNGIGSLPDQDIRWVVAENLRNKGYRFQQVIHPNAVIARNVTLEEGIQIMAGVIIQPDVKIGTDSIINTGVIIDHDCVISDNCHLAPGVCCSGSVSVGKNVHIGTGANIIQGVNIGEKTVIAAGTTLYKDIPPGSLVKERKNLGIEDLGEE